DDLSDDYHSDYESHESRTPAERERDAWEEKAGLFMRRVRDEMSGFWQEDDELVERLFGVDPTARAKTQALKRKYYSLRSKCWSGIYAKTQSHSGLKVKLRVLLNKLLLYQVCISEQIFIRVS